ncbi:MAG: bestrophin family protein, partial [Cytophagaceae bacterium]
FSLRPMLIAKKVPIPYIIRKIRYELLIFTIYSSLMYYLKEELHLWDFTMPLAIPALVGTTISLLLAFRINQSYERWWEARKLWGAIVNDSRTLIRQTYGFADSTKKDDPEIKKAFKRIAYRQIAWCYSLGHFLRGLSSMDGLKEHLTEAEIEQLKTHDHIPNKLLQLHLEDIHFLYEKGLINAYQQVQLESTLTRLCDSMGGCERIKRTIFPHTYSLFIHFFIYFFIMTLPLGLIDLFGVIEIPIVVIMASAFFLIEKTAIHLQDPFENKPTDTPVSTIARTIEINIKQMIGDKDIPEKLSTNGFYVL